jgi:3-phosphoglycerate kinase
MAALCDVYVMDAFGTAHRAEASTHGVAKFAKVACAGPLLMNELVALETALEKPKRPLVAIVAGSKVSTKLTVLETLLAKVDKLIVGGGDTLAAIEKYRVEDDISYISTGGGAFLEFLEGKKLPAVAALEERAERRG